MKLLLLILAALPAFSAETDIRKNYALIYDAVLDKGPCLATRDQYDRLVAAGYREMRGDATSGAPASPQPEAGKTRPDARTQPKGTDVKPKNETVKQVVADILMSCGSPFKFQDANGLPIAIVHPRFRAAYTATVVSQIDRGNGVLEVRGLNDIQPIALSALGTPVAHGGVPPSAVTIAALAPAQILAQLLDPAQMNQPELTITSQARDLSNGWKVLERDRAELMIEITAIRTGRVEPPPPANCDTISGAPTVGELDTCISSLYQQMLNDNRATNNPPAKHRENCTAQTSTGFFWTSSEFNCIVSQIDQRIGDLNLVRSRLNEYAFKAVADRIETETEALITKLNLLQQNVRVVQETLEDFETLRTAVVSPPAPAPVKPGAPVPPTAATRTVTGPATNQQTKDLRRAEIKKQLKDKYGSVLEEAELNRLAEAQVDLFDSSAFRAQYDSAIKVLRGVTADLSRYFAGGQLPGFELPLLGTLRNQEAQTRAKVTELSDAVDLLNRKFAQTFDAMNNVYLTFPDPQVQQINLDLTAGAGSNRDVGASLKSTEPFKPYRFGFTPPPAAQAPSLAPLIAAAPNPALTVSPANLPANIDRGFRFEMHKFWHANIVAGFVFSSIADVDFTTTTKTVQQNDAPATQMFASYSKNQRLTAHYLLGFNYYLRLRDTYLNAKRSTRDQWMPGILGGIGLESTKNFFVGPNWEPVLGVDFSVGLHYGEQNALPIGIVRDQTVLTNSLPGTLPTVMKTGVYGMVGFDLNIFRRFFGSVAK